MPKDDVGTVWVVAAETALVPDVQASLEAAGRPVVTFSPDAILRPDSSAPVAIVFCLHPDAADHRSALADWAREHPTVDIFAVSPPGAPTSGLIVLGACACLSPPLSRALLDRFLARSAERRRAIAALEQDLRHHQQVIEHVPIGIFELQDGRVAYANDEALRILCVPESKPAGRLFEEFVSPEDHSRLRAALAATASPGPTPRPVILHLQPGPAAPPTIGEIRLRRIDSPCGVRIEGILRNLTHETRRDRLHRRVLELGEIILAERDIDRILQLVLDTITEHSGFKRAVLSLYDLSIPVPFEGDVYKLLASGLSREELDALLEQQPMPVSERKLAFDERFQLGPAYYVPHDQTPWSPDRGLSGTVSVAGWHKDDFLFIPLRGTAGIIGSISVDDPVDGSAPTAESIEPVAYLANFAALAVERVYKLTQLQKQKERLHGLAEFGGELAQIGDVASLCDAAARRIQQDMSYDYCSIWIVDGDELTQMGVASRPIFPTGQISERGKRAPLEGPGLTRWALNHGDVVIVPDVRHDQRYNGVRTSVRSAMALPITGRKGRLGAIGVESQRLAAFGDQDVEVLSTLTSQLSIAISALRRREALSRIYALGQRISAASTIEQIVAGTLDFLIEQFDYQYSVLFLSDERGCLSVTGTRGPYAQRGVREGWVLPDGAGVVHWVARNKQAALIPDVQNDPRYFEAFPGTRSELSVPVLFSGRLLGVINVESPHVGFFDDEDRQLLDVIANHVAIALSNLASLESLRDQAVRDSLTGVYNRHYFNAIIASELSRSDRYGRPLSLMMIDVDGFRAVNNTLGHLKGDEVLQEVARLLCENVRASDRVIRYGGDEFLVFMPETASEAPTVAERLRSSIALLPKRTGICRLSIGLSIGIYTRTPCEDRPLESILEEVDRRMYADKQSKPTDPTDDNQPSPPYDARRLAGV